ncbi:hypothetical protein JYU09_00715 [bacterium AH-315-O15]|nr:hypothetical protein [bacterium AH-315-O15]
MHVRGDALERSETQAYQTPQRGGESRRVMLAVNSGCAARPAHVKIA